MTDGGLGEHAAHPAYTSPGLAAAATREYLTGPGRTMGGDADKAARAIYEIAHSENVGLRVPLGLDAIAGIEAQLESIRKDLEDARKWSVDLK